MLTSTLRRYSRSTPSSPWRSPGSRMASRKASVSDVYKRQVLQRVRQIIELQAASYGCQASIEHYPAYPVLVNSVEETEFARQVGVELAGAEQVDGDTPKLMGSEDFAWMLQRCPGSYLFIGNGRGRPMVHKMCIRDRDKPYTLQRRHQ